MGFVWFMQMQPINKCKLNVIKPAIFLQISNNQILLIWPKFNEIKIKIFYYEMKKLIFLQNP
jgi:hypothetical protein